MCNKWRLLSDIRGHRSDNNMSSWFCLLSISSLNMDKRKNQNQDEVKYVELDKKAGSKAKLFYNYWVVVTRAILSTVGQKCRKFKLVLIEQHLHLEMPPLLNHYSRLNKALVIMIPVPSC